MNKVLIIDGLNMFIRNWVVVPMMNTNGDHIGGVIGFLRSLKLLIRENQPTRVIITWDGKGGSQKRRGVYAEYKAGRKPRVNRQYDFGESPEQSQADLAKQYALTRRYLDMLGLAQIEVEAVEADDIIGFLCRGIFEGTDKVVVSSDKDFFQLIDPKTVVYSPTKKVYYSGDVLKERFGVIPENFIYMKSLMGDGSDNIKGIKGVGEKTVVKLFPFLSEHESSLEEIFQHAEANEKKSPKYKAVLDGRELLITNFKLMQLTSPIISPQTVRAIRYSVEQERTPLNSTALKMAFLRDGVQITDQDFFIIFSEYHKRAEKEAKTNDK